MITSMLIDKCSFSNVNGFSSSSTQIYSKVVGGPVPQTLQKRHASQTLPVHSDSNTKVASQRYKTELCRSFDETGLCKYGEKCQFAHGYHELRSLNRHPKYKTVLCRTYHCTGYCPYGPRCHFVHDECSETIPSQPKSSSISPSSSFGSDIRSSVSSSRSISPMDSPILSTEDYFFLPSFLSDETFLEKQ